MDRDSLAELIRAADREAGPPPLADDLSARVRARAAGYSRVKGHGAAVAALLLFALGSGWLLVRPVSPREQVVDAIVQAPAELRRELAAIRAEAEARIALVRRLQFIKSGGSLGGDRHAAVPIDAHRQMRRELDRAAFTIVYTADILWRETDLTDSAVERYKQAVRLFPQSPSAQTARRRLATINNESGGTS